MLLRRTGGLRGLAAVGQGEVEELGGFGEVERAEQGLLAGCGRGTLGDLAVAGGEGDQVHPVEFVADVAPGVAGGVLDHPQEQQRQPAKLDVGADAVLAVVEHRAQPQGVRARPGRGELGG